jgi:hypothetical protein
MLLSNAFKERMHAYSQQAENTVSKAEEMSRLQVSRFRE